MSLITSPSGLSWPRPGKWPSPSAPTDSRPLRLRTAPVGRVQWPHDQEILGPSSLRSTVPLRIAERPAVGRPPLCPPDRRTLPAGKDHPVRLLCLRHAAQRERRRSIGHHAGPRRGRSGHPDQRRVRTAIFALDHCPHAQADRARLERRRLRLVSPRGAGEGQGLV